MLGLKAIFDPGMALLQGLRYCISDTMCLLWRELGPSSFGNNERENSTKIASKRNIELDIDIRHLRISGIAVCTFLLAFLHGWTELTIKADGFFLVTLVESCLILTLLCVIQWNIKPSQSKVAAVLMPHRSWLILAMLQSIVLIWMGSYVKGSAANANRSDIYELFLVFTVPSILVSTHLINSYKMKVSEIALLVVAGIKLLVLCRDPIFLPNTAASVSCFLASLSYGIFLALLYTHLHKETILSVLQLLTAWRIPIAFLLSIFHGEKIHQLLSMRMMLVLFLMASLTMGKFALTSILLKHTNPLICIITINSSWIPLTLVRAFVFKFLFLVSSFKLSFLFLSDVIFVSFKNKLDSFIESFRVHSNLDFVIAH